MTQQLSQGQQLIAIYDVVGWGTEQTGSPYRIQQRAQDPNTPPAQNKSAYSVGTLQTDFGQNSNSTALSQFVSAYNTFAANSSNNVPPIPTRQGVRIGCCRRQEAHRSSLKLRHDRILPILYSESHLVFTVNLAERKNNNLLVEKIN